jgi:iron complex outermembrane receptor protein
VIDAAGTMNFLRFTGTRRDRISTGEIGVRGRLQTGRRRAHAGAVGGELPREDATRRSLSRRSPGVNSGTLTAPVVFAPPPTGRVRPARRSATRRPSSIAIADTLSFMQGRLLVTLGARQQTFKDTGYDREPRDAGRGRRLQRSANALGLRQLCRRAW